MKRSKIFLGVTTCLLAIAGVAAANHYGPNTGRWYVTFAGNVCAKLPGATCIKSTLTTAIPCTVTVVKVGVTKHLKIYTQGVVGGQPNTCTNQLFYTRAD